MYVSDNDRRKLTHPWKEVVPLGFWNIERPCIQSHISGAACDQSVRVEELVF